LSTAGGAGAFQEQLARLLPKLPPIERQVVELRLKGRSIEKIAAELGVNDRKIRLAFSRALVLLTEGRARGKEHPG
jgi:DNA-directed RNA polymerase specialized sigma24 family protein